jgi:nuclear pore complex protein Nup205
VEYLPLQLLGQLDLKACTKHDAYGCEVIDTEALFTLLTASRRALHEKNAITTTEQSDQLNTETAYILESCTAENNRRQVQHAAAQAYAAWGSLLDITLLKCFPRLSHERREIVLLDLLTILPETIRTSEISDATSILVSEATLSCMAKLREDSHAQAVAGNCPLPADRLFSVLRGIIEALLDGNRLEQVRGNLYASLINYFYLASPAATSRSGLLTASQNGLGSSLSLSTSRALGASSFLAESTASYANGALSSSLQAFDSGNLMIVKQVADRLVATIARDAMDGSQVWRTVGFTLLDSLAHLSRGDKQQTVVSALVSHGILSNFVRSLKEEDVLLRSMLKPDPGEHITSVL